MSKTVCQNTLPFHSHRNITARFDGGSLTSDAGWLLFGSLEIVGVYRSFCNLRKVS